MNMTPDIKIIEAARVGATTCYGCGATEGVRALSVGHRVEHAAGRSGGRVGTGNSVSVSLCAACGDRLAAIARSGDASKTRSRVEDAIYDGIRSGVLMLEDMDDDQAVDYETTIDAVIAAACGAPPIAPDAAHLREELARMTIECVVLRGRLASISPDRWRWRGVEDPCGRCGGAGTCVYASGATWRRGMGTASPERDVCDRCWGTGDKFRSGANLRALRDEEDRRVAERAVDLVAEAFGASIGTVRGAVPHLIAALDKVADKRGAPAATFLPELAIGLGNMLRRAIDAPERVR